MSNSPSNGEAVEGIVTARSCDCCGHHEIGILTAAGNYIPLKPGMQVKISHQAEPEDGESVG